RQLRGLIGFASDRGEVPRGRREHPLDPAWNLGEVVGVPADGVRLGMGLPGELVLWNPLQHLARARHLAVELRQYRFGVVHRIPLPIWQLSNARGETATLTCRGRREDIVPGMP